MGPKIQIHCAPTVGGYNPPMVSPKEKWGLIWDYYKPRQTHAWNMMVMAWRELENFDQGAISIGFEIEYCWENFILRLWLYRITVLTLSKIDPVSSNARKAVRQFDVEFDMNGRNGLKALRDMIEHFDDYAAGIGRGPAQRDADLDPFRSFTTDEYERGSFRLERAKSLNAVIALRADAKAVSDEFIAWFRSPS